MKLFKIMTALLLTFAVINPTGLRAEQSGQAVKENAAHQTIKDKLTKLVKSKGFKIAGAGAIGAGVLALIAVKAVNWKCEKIPKNCETIGPNPQRYAMKTSFWSNLQSVWAYYFPDDKAF